MLECSRHIFSATFTQTIDHFLQCLSALCQGILRLWRHHRIYFAVNQYESNSLHPADHVIPYCQAHDIVVQAWGPLGQGQGGLFTNPIVTQISGKHHKTPAQIILCFSLRKVLASFQNPFIWNARNRISISWISRCLRQK